MIVKEFKLGNTTIEVDNTYFPETKEENERRWKQMKKAKIKLDKNKIYAFIGRAVVYSSVYVATVLGSVWAFLECTTVYR